MGLISTLYRATRLAADVDAIRRGPKAAARRYAAKPLYRATNNLLTKLIRQITR